MGSLITIIAKMVRVYPQVCMHVPFESIPKELEHSIGRERRTQSKTCWLNVCVFTFSLFAIFQCMKACQQIFSWMCLGWHKRSNAWKRNTKISHCIILISSYNTCLLITTLANHFHNIWFCQNGPTTPYIQHSVFHACQISNPYH